MMMIRFMKMHAHTHLEFLMIRSMKILAHTHLEYSVYGGLFQFLWENDMYTSDVCNEIVVVCDDVMLKKKSINAQINSEALQPAPYSVKNSIFTQDGVSEKA